MFGISIVDVLVGLELLAVIIIVRLFIYVVRQLVAIHNVKVAYKALTRWNKRHNWAIEDGSFFDAQGFEWSADEIEVVLQARNDAFNKAVDQRNLIRF